MLLRERIDEEHGMSTRIGPPGDLRRVNREALSQPMKAYVRRAMDELRDACPQSAPVLVTGLSEWQRISENAFGLRDHEEPFWVACIRQSGATRHAWPEYQAVEDVIRADAVLGGQIETLVGTAFGAARQELEHISDAVIWTLAARNGGFTFSEAVFVEEFERFVDSHEATQVDIVVLGPLIGLKGDGFPLVLEEPGVEIVDFNDSEIASCLRMGLVGSPIMADYRFIERVVGLRLKFSVPKQVGGGFDNAPDLATSLETKISETAEYALSALRTFKQGRVTLSGMVRLAKLGGGLSHAGGPAPGTGGFWWGDYEANQLDADQFKRYWKQLRNARTRRLVDAAIRRFTYSLDRNRADDRIVDLVIAAETLFLGDAGNPQERGELRYRYALRASFFLSGAGPERRAMFRFMRSSYDARSAIVHGGEPDTTLLRSVDGRALTLQEYADALEEILRQALRKSVDIPGGSATGPIVDWDELIMGA